jgi:hypothetical protein
MGSGNFLESIVVDDKLAPRPERHSVRTTIGRGYRPVLDDHFREFPGLDSAHDVARVEAQPEQRGVNSRLGGKR